MAKLYVFYDRRRLTDDEVKQLKTTTLKQYTKDLINYIKENSIKIIFADTWEVARGYAGYETVGFRKQPRYLGFVLKDLHNKAVNFDTLLRGQVRYDNLVKEGFITTNCMICGVETNKTFICEKCINDPIVKTLAERIKAEKIVYDFDNIYSLDDVINEDKTQRLLRYINKFNIKIDDKGRLIFYKAIRSDNKSFYTSKFVYPESGYVEENNYNDDLSNSCGGGLHVANINWVLSNYNGRDTKLIECIVEPKDIIAIAHSTSGKIRVKRLFVGKSCPMELLNAICHLIQKGTL